MMNQSRAWGLVAQKYDELFVDPYEEDGRNPVLRAIAAIHGKSSIVVGDFGCGTGPFLPRLAAHFKHVIAVDFSEEMIKQARKRCKGIKNISFHHLPFDLLDELPQQVDLAVTMNSLVSSDVTILDHALVNMRKAVRRQGHLFGIVPSLEGLFYHIVLLTDLAVERGMNLNEAQQFAAHKAELHGYDLKTATFTFDKIHQHLWLKEEVGIRLQKAGYRRFQIRKTGLPWSQFAEGRALKKFPQSWDWAFKALV